MNLTQDIIDLVKVLHDARMRDCHFKAQAQSECDKFPVDLKPHTYTVEQPWIDIAIAQSVAVMKYYKMELKNLGK